MRELLIMEMKRAIGLLEGHEKPFRYWGANGNNSAAELSQLMRLVRKHSVALEKQDKKWEPTPIKKFGE